MADYIPPAWDWVREQVERYEGSGGKEGTTLRETGLPVMHRRTVDTLGQMLANGTITQEMHDAGAVFRRQFRVAALDQIIGRFRQRFAHLDHHQLVGNHRVVAQLNR